MSIHKPTLSCEIGLATANALDRVRRRFSCRDEGKCVFSVQSATLWLLLSVAGTVEGATAAKPISEEKVAVSAIAALEICHGRNPERGLTLERLVSDPSFSEERKSEYRRVNADPSYKEDILTMKAFLLEPELAGVLSDVCENLRKTSPDGYR